MNSLPAGTAEFQTWNPPAGRLQLFLLLVLFFLLYEGKSIIIRNAVAFVFPLAALSFSRASLGVVFFLSHLCRFEVALSVPLSQP